MTFLPLATVKCSEPSERLRQLGGTAKLAVDLVEFEDKFKRAFYSACGCVLGVPHCMGVAIFCDG